VQTFFHQDIADPNLYDLVINTDYFEFAAVANIILYAMKAGHYAVPNSAQAGAASF
jgi:cytidylate kinase